MPEPSVSRSSAGRKPTRAPLHDRYLVTCEHGGNRIPARYRPMFADAQSLLDTHRGYDPGALQLGREIAAALDAPLVSATVSRLLVDLNRSMGHPRLHWDPVRALPPAERDRIVHEHYEPYRQAAESHVRDGVSAGRLIHISSHSFTPVFDGRVRTADIGLLYDPARAGEVALCAAWKQALHDCAPELRVRRNYPYAGTGDGLTSFLRSRYSARRYVGIELEVNQKYVLGGGSPWRRMRAVIRRSLDTALAQFSLRGYRERTHPGLRAVRRLAQAPRSSS
jgi:predicted N-formylglutamate amidohydrolase